MKKISLIIGGLLISLLSLNVNVYAQSPADYFVGKWKVVVKGTPNGDANMILVLEKKENSLIGVVQDESGNQITKIDKAELGEDSATFYFNAEGYNVTLVLTKADADHVTGNLLGMFEAEGERIIAPKQ
jgi:hypothetical protein